ncbi:MAG: ABC transporter substrate-binding protein [Bradyrhizobiaceae bacterium]|nr:ABC transporter substrate-binding protein [Bradyrhizobiaceae bacterium]
MKRRGFLQLVGATVIAWPLPARAQGPDQMRRIAALMSIAEADPEGRARVAAFEEGLRSLGWSSGRNLRIEWRWAAGDPNRMQAYAAELVAMKMEVILANGPHVTEALLKETRDIPIVFVQVADPRGSGFVASLAKPGGNVTGFASFEPGLGSKWLDILKQIAPGVTRIQIILDPQFAGYVALSHVIESRAPTMGVVPIVARVHNSADIKDAIDTFAKEPNGGLIVLPSPIAAVERELIVALAAEHRLPAVYPYGYFASSGGLVAYGVDELDLYRRGASYVDLMLKGEKPWNLPVQHPTKFDFVINLSTAKELGLIVPPPLLVSATKFIE